MPKSIKLKDNTYLDSSSVIHKPINTNDNEKVELRTALGNWGCGTVLNDFVGDLNNLRRSGYYMVNDSTANIPTNTSYYIIVLVKNKDYYTMQIAIPRDNNSHLIYIRKIIGEKNKWGNWEQLIPTNYVKWEYLGYNPDIDLIEYRSHGGQYGIYNCTKAPTMDIGILEVKSYSEDWCQQIFYNCYNQCWVRSFYSGTTWTDWVKIY